MVDAIIINKIPQAVGICTTLSSVEHRIVQTGGCTAGEAGDESIDRRTTIVQCRTAGGTGGSGIRSTEDAMSQVI